MAGDVRQQRVSQAIRRALSVMFLREYGGTQLGSVVVGDVRMSPDLRIARVSYTILPGGNPRVVAERLQEEAGHLRKLLSKDIGHLKYMPELTFRFDDKAEEVVRLQTLLEEMSNDRKEKGEPDDSGDPVD